MLSKVFCGNLQAASKVIVEIQGAKKSEHNEDEGWNGRLLLP